MHTVLPILEQEEASTITRLFDTEIATYFLETTLWQAADLTVHVHGDTLRDSMRWLKGRATFALMAMGLSSSLEADEELAGRVSPMSHPSPFKNLEAMAKVGGRVQQRSLVGGGIFVVKGISRKIGPCQTPYHPGLVHSGGL